MLAPYRANNFKTCLKLNNTALGSDGQGPKGFSFVFLDLFTHLFDFFDIFAEVPGPT